MTTKFHSRLLKKGRTLFTSHQINTWVLLLQEIFKVLINKDLLFYIKTLNIWSLIFDEKRPKSQGWYPVKKSFCLLHVRYRNSTVKRDMKFANNIIVCLCPQFSYLRIMSKKNEHNKSWVNNKRNAKKIRRSIDTNLKRRMTS